MVSFPGFSIDRDQNFLGQKKECTKTKVERIRKQREKERSKEKNSERFSKKQNKKVQILAYAHAPK